MIGGVTSVTTTVNEQETEPAELDAVKVTRVVPSAKVLPLPSPVPLPVVAPLKE